MATKTGEDTALIITKGVVIGERSSVKSERMITLYTEKLGVIEVYAHSAKGVKNSLFSALSIFSYCEFGLARRRGGVYVVKEAQVIKSFFSLSESLEGISLALYLAELIRCISPTEEEAVHHLPFFLNTLFLIGKREYDLDLLKAVFELRTMSGHGFMPTAVACSSCYEYKEQPHMLDYKSGKLICADCVKQLNLTCNLSSAGVAAMRHIIFSEQKSIFSFKLNDPKGSGLTDCIEKFTLWHLDRRPKSLDFYKGLFKGL